ncbi:hypothetical protein C8R47DRAFT_1208088 [Mycena vitilis]|nr:hypothetical protein C8R47DRAFT_1208088 [Mycena vitilis]
MSTPAAQAVMTAELLIVRRLYGTSLIGFAVATTIYGITVSQVYLYYRNYPSDRFMLKFTVALLFAIDTLSSVFVGYHVFNFFSPLQSLEVPWSFAAEKFLVTLTTFVAQSFYAQTIWKATSNKLTVWIIMFMALTSLSLGIVTTEEIFDGTLSTVSTRRFQIISGLVQGVASLNDPLFATIYGATGVTSLLADTWQIPPLSYPGSSAFSIAQILFLITNVGLPGQTYWQPFHQVVGKLYVNSVLVTLNVRSTFAQKSEIHIGTGPSFMRSDLESKVEPVSVNYG